MANNTFENVLWFIFNSRKSFNCSLVSFWCLCFVWWVQKWFNEILTEIQRFLQLLHMLGLIFLTPCYNRLDAIASLLPPVLGAWMLNQLNTSKTWYNSQYYSHCMAAAISFLTELYYMCILNFIFAILFWGMSDQCKHVYDCMFC